MSHQIDDIEIEMKDSTKPLSKNSKKSIKNEILDNESLTNDDTSISSLSFPNKKFGKKSKLLLSSNSEPNNIIHIMPEKKSKEKLKENLSSIKEEKFSNSNENEEKDDGFFYLFNENKEEKKALSIEEIKSENKDKDKIVESESIGIKNNEEENKIIDNEKEEDNKKDINNETKKKKITYPKEENVKKSKVNSKSQLDLEFLKKEEQESESEDDFKYYIQKAYDQEEEYKIIFEFNKLPYKPKELLIDLGVFDDEAILKCIIIYNFDIKELRFILKLYFVYLSKENEIYTKKDNDKIIMNYFLNEEKNKENKENNENDEKEDNNDKNDLDNIQLKVFFKRFRIVKGNYSQVASGTKIIKKKNELDGFQKIIFEEEEDLVNYSNYHKVFYILQIQKINKITSIKKTLPVKKIGIQNEGNTCYMNSIIQSIYNNQFLLKNIMKINTNSEIFSNEKNEKDKDVISNLQTIFYKLSKNKYSIKIVDIFYAFKWNRYFWNSPQDAEEIYMEIYEIFSIYSEDIKDNCEGILENTIEVKEIDYKSIKEENFFFLQLDIENNHSLEECLENFFKNEELKGDNKYQYIDDFGNKSFYDANKFYKFKKTPNILFIQLKRFQYDSKTLSFNKKNNRISFKEEIDLTNYINENNNNSKNKRSKKAKEKELYTLYCILVHSGSVESGHYFCFVKDFQNNCYIKFNDTSVSLAEEREVFNDIFGGEIIEYVIKNTSKKKYEPKYEVIDNIKEISKNAYILIYIKKNKINDLFNDNNEIIQNLFEEYLKREKEKKVNNNDDNSSLYQFKEVRYPKTKITKIKKNDHKKTMVPRNIKSLPNNDNLNENNEKFKEVFSEVIAVNDRIFDNNESKNKKDKLRNKRKTIENKKKGLYKYVGNQDKLIEKIEYPKNTLKDLQINFYLINDLSNKIKGIFLLEYNTNIKVKDVKDKIRRQLNNEKTADINRKIFEEIVNSPGYKLALINYMGFFIQFLDEDEDYDITHLFKNNNNENKKIKHLCLYNFKQIKNKEKIEYAFIINFISKDLLDLIISKNENIYNNFSFEVKPPAFIINEEIEGIEKLNNRIKDIYLDFFGNEVDKNFQFKIYLICNKDILNLDILKIQYKELTKDEFLLYTSKVPNQNTYVNLLVGY